MVCVGNRFVWRVCRLSRVIFSRYENKSIIINIYITSISFFLFRCIFHIPLSSSRKRYGQAIRKILVETYRVKYPVKKNCVPMVAYKTAPNHLRIQTLSNGKYLIIDTFKIHLSIEFYLYLYLRKYFRLGSKPYHP